MRFGLFGFSDFRKLVFLDHRNFGEISQNLHFYCSLRYNFAKFSLKFKFFLNEFEFSLKIFNFFMLQKFSVPSAPTIGLLGRFLEGMDDPKDEFDQLHPIKMLFLNALVSEGRPTETRHMPI